MEQHNKIINDVAKKVLSPAGLFREGRSRCWIDDNEWFMIQVEFQPSSYEKGSYLNVGIAFLWESTEELNQHLAFEYGGRVIVGKGTQFAEYRPKLKNCDSIFEKEIEQFADAALQKIMEYRKFRDLEYAKKSLMQKAKSTQKESLWWEIYNLAMLCFFKQDFDEGMEYFNDYSDRLKNSFYRSDFHIDWCEDFYNYCQKEILPKIISAETAQHMVFDMINRRRAFFYSKSSFKKMKKDVIF